MGEITAQVLNRIRDVDPNNSEAVKDALAAFFQNINKHTQVDCNRWLHALENVINRFPKYCMSHRNTIETYLVHFLDTNNYYAVIEAAKCAHVLQQVRPPQEKTATAKGCWRAQMSALCNAIQTLLGAIFPDAVDIYRSSVQSEKQSAQPTNNSPLLAALNELNTTRGLDKKVNKQSLLCTRLRNVFVFLQAMLVEVYPVAKPIQPQTILETLVRVLSVTSANQKGQNTSDVAAIKIEALQTIDALIVCLGSNLTPFSALVIRFVMQTLKWSSDYPSDESSKVRCRSYNTVVRWLGVLHAHRPASDGRARSWEDELAKHITDDVTPAKHVVQLTMSTQPTKHLSKKAKRKLTKSMLQESSIASHMPGEKNKIHVSEQMNDEVAIAALECAEMFLTVCGIFLKPTTHKLFQDRIVRECFNLELYSNERSLALLRALEASRKSTSPTVPPPTQYCLQLYSVMTNSQQREISKFCTQALLDIRLHLHCSLPSLNFAIEVTEDKQKKADNKRKKMSERNRAALEALLGTDKVPPEDTEVIITIQDEPSVKKPRLDEDITDKISVSSDSIRSVEISDESDEDIEIIPLEEENVTNSEEEVEELNTVEEIDGSVETTVVVEPTTTIDEAENTVIDNNDEAIKNMETISSEIVLESIKTSDILMLPEESEPTIESTQVNIDIEQNATHAHTENIFDAKTQLPHNVSNDTTEEDNIPLSEEIAYDLPNTAKEVPVLEKMEDENLPSTNDTDDIQITCGQIVKSSQDLDAEKNKEVEDKVIDVPKVNGNKSPEKNVEIEPIADVTEKITVKITATNDEVSVDDMLADFVDEVNEENKI